MARTANVRMVTAKRACVFAILVGGVVSVSFVDSGERETEYFGVHNERNCCISFTCYLKSFVTKSYCHYISECCCR